jgi:hypothetical protein
VKHTTGFYPPVWVDAVGKGVVSQAGGSLLTEVVRISGLDRLLQRGWRLGADRWQSMVRHTWSRMW